MNDSCCISIYEENEPRSVPAVSSTSKFHGQSNNIEYTVQEVIEGDSSYVFMKPLTYQEGSRIERTAEEKLKQSVFKRALMPLTLDNVDRRMFIPDRSSDYSEQVGNENIHKCVQTDRRVKDKSLQLNKKQILVLWLISVTCVGKYYFVTTCLYFFFR